jgi:hypothetical protein
MQSVAIALAISQRLALPVVEAVGVALTQTRANRIPGPAAFAPGVAHAGAVVDGVAATCARANGSPVALTIAVSMAMARAAAHGTTWAAARAPSMAHP